MKYCRKHHIFTFTDHHRDFEWLWIHLLQAKKQKIAVFITWWPTFFFKACFNNHSHSNFSYLVRALRYLRRNVGRKVLWTFKIVISDQLWHSFFIWKIRICRLKNVSAICLLSFELQQVKPLLWSHAFDETWRLIRLVEKSAACCSEMGNWRGRVATWFFGDD